MSGELVTSSDIIESGRPADLLISIQNRQSVPVTLHRLDVMTSAGLRTCAWQRTGPDAAGATICDGTPPPLSTTPGRRVEPGDSVIYRYELRTGGRTWPGAKLIVVAVHGDYVLNGKAKRASLTLSKRVQSTVLGEAQFISGIGVPSFLLLPGFLLLATYRLLARRSRQADAGVPQLDVNAIEFIALSASLSILAIPFFWVVSWLAGEPRTYLDGYDTRDLLSVWIGSVLAGAVAFSVPASVAGLRLRLRTPQPTDSPEQALSRLARAGETLNRTQIRFRHAGPSGDVPAQAFVYAAPAAEGEPYWAMPAIQYTCEAEAPPEVQRELLELLRGGDSAKGVRDFLHRHSREVKLAWEPGILPGPVQVSAARVQAEVSAAPLLRMVVPQAR
ncbi:hypothetical protein ACIHCQ_15100 [Streptomyces sp. NPDC052236]|uniref:hypothetical protein n=1 Tax=Streptomyces sp. NPDC052236 TaxID=3365686 RepID=UPI0037D43234